MGRANVWLNLLYRQWLRTNPRSFTDPIQLDSITHNQHGTRLQNRLPNFVTRLLHCSAFSLSRHLINSIAIYQFEHDSVLTKSLYSDMQLGYSTIAMSSSLVAISLSLLSIASASASASLFDRGLPADATDVKTITSPGGATIRYKEPGKAGVCETTPGVNSYAGYVDLDGNDHMFFQFFEARTDPANAPITLWLNGGPGSDSLIGLYVGQ
jgi:Serine carboxypeptidase